MNASPLTVVIRLRGLARLIVRRVAQLQLTQTAANLAFLSLLALVPIFTIAVSLLGATPMFARLRDALLKFLSANLFLPSFSETLVRYLNQFAAKASQLSLIGGLAFFATAFTALLTIDRTLNQIWAVGRPRPLARRLTLYWTFLTLGPLLVGATLTFNGLVVSELFGAMRLREVERLWLALLPWLASVAGLTLLYRLVPNAPVRWRDALIGALLATIALELLKRGLGLQLARLPTYTIVYGTFAALPLFLVWLFMVWLIVLAAAVLTASLPSWGEGLHAPRPETAGRSFERARRVLEALLAARAAGQSAVQAGPLRVLFDDDPVLADVTARRLSSLGYLHRHWRLDAPGPAGTGAMRSRAGGVPAVDSPVWQEWWLLAPNAHAMTLRPLFEHCWSLPLAPEAAGAAGGEPAAAPDARLPGPIDLERPLQADGQPPTG
ncbi:MAG: YihY family inner membrane protein [Burkholderiaceae bacterium]|nr:YihY family inner membrane protein [Burkholderiaceae bacterium]